MSVEKRIDGGDAPEEMTAAWIASGLRELSTLMAGHKAGKELREQIIEQARRFFRADAVAMWRLESRERIWRIAVTTGLSEDYSEFTIPAPADGNVAAMLPGPMLIAEARAWPLGRVPRNALARAPHADDIRSWMGADAQARPQRGRSSRSRSGRAGGSSAAPLDSELSAVPRHSSHRSGRMGTRVPTRKLIV